MEARVRRLATIRIVTCSPVFAVGAERLVVGFHLNFNTLAKASLMGLYKR